MKRRQTRPIIFNKKSVWARISVIAAGPIFNFILAWVFSVILIFMTVYDEPVVGAVEEGYPAYEAGLRPGDRITEDGRKKYPHFPGDFCLSAVSSGRKCFSDL